MLNEKKIIIGTAQLVDNYGITNFSTKKNKKKIHQTLENFLKEGLYKFDTAPGYRSEKILGNFFKYKNYEISPKITTKIPSLYKFNNKEKIDYLIKNLEKSLKNLNFDIDTVLFHDQKDIDYVLKNHDLISSIIKSYKIKNFGFSIYDYSFFLKIKNFEKKLYIQVPTNFINDIFLKIKLNKNIKMIGRSIFLQGFLINKNLRKIKKNIYEIHKKYFQYLDNFSINPFLLSLSIMQNKNINQFVIGFDNFEQYEFIKNLKSKKNYNYHIKKIKNIFKKSDIIDPRKWVK
jgi:aryl-alcohol dehydrogenase-like predicted oxidoreductase